MKFENLIKRLDSDVQVIFFTTQSFSCESGAQGTMNKDLRLARKGPPTGFGHGRRHSCLGYVPKLRILHLAGAHTHEKEKTYMYYILNRPHTGINVPVSFFYF